MNKEAKLVINGEEISLPILSGTYGHDVIDIAKLASAGYFTYDPRICINGVM